MTPPANRTALAIALVGAGLACRRSPPACNAIKNEATPVPFTAKSGPLPVLAGGPLEDGVYQATRAEGYGAVAASGRRMTLAVSAGGTELGWSGDVLDAAGATVLASIHANARVTASGNRLDLTTICSSVSPDPLPARMAYAARPGELVLGLVEAGGGFVTTYTRVPPRTDTPR